MTALTTFRDWLTAHQRSHAVMAGLFAASLALMVAAAFLGEVLSVPALPAILGSLAGLALFLSAYSACLLLLPAETLARLDIKARYPLTLRRPAVAALAVIWLIVLLLLGKYLPEVLGGALNVAVLLALFAVWSPTPAEAQAQADAQAQAEADAAAQAEVDAQD